MLQQHDVARILNETATPVLSLYLNVNPAAEENQATTPAWRIWLKNALRDLEASFDGAQKREWIAIRTRAEAFFEQYSPEGKGLVAFFTEDGEEVHHLPLPVENQIGYGEPLVTPLFWQLDEYERYLIALVDKQEARFLTAYLGSSGEEERMEIDLDEYDFREMTLMPATSYGKQLTQGSNREAFEDMIGDHRTRFFRDVVARLDELCEKHETTRVILGGGQDAVSEVRNLMSDKLANRVVDTLPIPLRTAPHEIIPLIQPIAEAYERQHEAQLLDSVIDLAKAGGRGALGRKAVLEALEQQRVELLIAPWPLPDDELMQSLPQRALNSGAKLELVHGEAAERLNAEGGIAARLYYAL